MDYKTIEAKAQKARELALSINPKAKVEYTFNQFGKKFCNGLHVDDCCGIVRKIGEELTMAGRFGEAAEIHGVPLFVFAMLDHDEVLQFIPEWVKYMAEEEKNHAEM